MGRFTTLSLAALTLTTPSCRDAGAVPLRQRHADVVSFEVGGDGRALGELLRSVRSAPVPPIVVEVPPRDVVATRPARLWRVVPLPAGYTLSRLCSEELGAADRWREVAELNGWSEDAVRNLPERTPVKLPPR